MKRYALYYTSDRRDQCSNIGEYLHGGWRVAGGKLKNYPPVHVPNQARKSSREPAGLLLHGPKARPPAVPREQGLSLEFRPRRRVKAPGKEKREMKLKKTTFYRCMNGNEGKVYALATDGYVDPDWQVGLHQSANKHWYATLLLTGTSLPANATTKTECMKQALEFLKEDHVTTKIKEHLNSKAFKTFDEQRYDMTKRAENEIT